MGIKHLQLPPQNYPRYGHNLYQNHFFNIEQNISLFIPKEIFYTCNEY